MGWRHGRLHKAALAHRVICPEIALYLLRSKYVQQGEAMPVYISVYISGVCELTYSQWMMYGVGDQQWIIHFISLPRCPGVKLGVKLCTHLKKTVNQD
jgi:hypothetical protein